MNQIQNKKQKSDKSQDKIRSLSLEMKKSSGGHV